MKKLTVKFLEKDRCLEHLFDSICTGTVNFSDKLFSQLKNSEGIFFTIVPENTPEEYLYKFNTGGLIISENAYSGVSPHLLINPSTQIMDSFFKKTIEQNQEINLGIKDFNGQPDDEIIHYPFVKSILDEAPHTLNENKDSSFHLVNDYKTNLKKAMILWGWASNRWCPVCLFKLNKKDQSDLNSSKKVDDEMQSKIVMNVFSIVIYIYDDEGYLIWYKKGHDFILNDISQIVDSYNLNGESGQTTNY